MPLTNLFRTTLVWIRDLRPCHEGCEIGERGMELVVYDLTVDTYYNLLCQDLQKQITSVCPKHPIANAMVEGGLGIAKVRLGSSWDQIAVLYPLAPPMPGAGDSPSMVDRTLLPTPPALTCAHCQCHGERYPFPRREGRLLPAR